MNQGVGKSYTGIHVDGNSGVGGEPKAWVLALLTFPWAW
jgi:hypothetical protein